MSDYIEVLDETDPGSNLVGDTLKHTDIKNYIFWLENNLYLHYSHKGVIQGHSVRTFSVRKL